MEIENEVFFHIQRNPYWKVGEKYETGKERNHFTNHIRKFGTNCKCFHLSNGDSIDINPLFLAQEVIKVSDGGPKDSHLMQYFDYNPITTIKILKQTLSEHMKFTREVVLEEVRKELFIDKPSRQNCFWLIESDNDAIRYWLETLDKVTKKLFRVEATGKIHIADQTYLDLSADPLDGLKQRAIKYWKSESPKKQTFNECVFEGTIHVISEESIKDYL